MEIKEIPTKRYASGDAVFFAEELKAETVVIRSSWFHTT